MTTRLTIALLALTLAACSKDPDSNNANNVDPNNSEPDAANNIGPNNNTGDGGNNITPNNNIAPNNVTPGDMGSGSDTNLPDMPVVIDMGPPPDPTEGAGAAELVQEGFSFTEGPRWYPAENVLRFTDIPENTIFELAEPNTITEFTTASQGANGLAFDGNGNVLAAEHGGRRISVYNNGNAMDLVADYNGDQFNSPNDLVLRNDGTIYFTDPPYGLTGQREIDFNGLFRYDPSDGSVTAEWEGSMQSRPNGVVLSPDQTVLYLADTAGNSVTAFDVAADGSLSGERDFVDVQGPDGMAMDVWGNLYVTTNGGIEVFAPDGTSWGLLPVGRRPANCAFGGADARTLYVTAREGLYRIALPVQGIY